ncbi:MAG: hypothetical protein ABI763_04280, partial [Bacteroidota bacterium]
MKFIRTADIIIITFLNLYIVHTGDSGFPGWSGIVYLQQNILLLLYLRFLKKLIPFIKVAGIEN